MQDLNITLIQSPLYWHDVDANLAMFEEKIWQIREHTDLIILPEMFTTGFTNECTSQAEVMRLKTHKWMMQMAAQTNAHVTGSLIIKEGSHFFNRLLWLNPEGEVKIYDKKHLFSLALEDQYFTAGTDRLIVDLNGWKICPLICYDLRFPVWCRNNWQLLKQHQYDLLLFVANWPAVRIHAWDTLLQARAIENLSFVAGINRTGKDRRGNEYNGHSVVIDPLGKMIFNAGEDEMMKTISLSFSHLRQIRKKIPFYLDGDNFSIH